MSQSDESLKQLWTIARNYARRKGFANHAEDFAQECVMGRVNGRTTTIGNLFVDYLRKNFGRNQLKREAKAREQISYQAIVEDDTHTYQDSNIVPALIKDFSKEDRCIFLLKYIWGFSIKEIAYCFGMKESAVLYKIKQFKRIATKENW